MEQTTISFNDKDELSAAIKEHRNFLVSDIEAAQSVAVNWLEKEIESQGMRCRIYTSKRLAAVASAAVIPIVPTQIVAVLTGIAVALHNLGTRDPDYEICKGMIDGSVAVSYRKG